MLGKLGGLLNSNEKELKKIRPLISQINDLEKNFKKYSDTKLKSKTIEFKKKLKHGTSLNEVLPEAFAAVREASKRTVKMRHYDVQLLSGIVLHEGKISEQKTGEGKTLSATLPAYLNALEEKGVHVVTVNDYLAKRDSEWMKPIYESLGLSVGYVVHEIPPGTSIRREMYKADITYGTNNEFGFDYLRDNMVWDLKNMVQRGHNYAIVDEVDSILIDEARTPLIISAPSGEATDKYYTFAKMVNSLNAEVDFVVDEKLKSASLSEAGIQKVEKILGISNLYETNFSTIHHIEQAISARTLFVKDRDYVVRGNEVVIVDEFTGRLMEGRRYSEGLHQAIEAKENVTIQEESRTLATITFQNYFRMYHKLAGMTGTAETEAEEFFKIYKLDVVVIPPHRPNIRKDHSDIVYKTAKAKFLAVAEEVKELHKTGQPVLIGTTSIEKNELLSEVLKKTGIKHEVLNAKNHTKEAEIISLAGHKGAVTLATNIAGRGVDIKLEKNIDKLGGLHIIGTERHESRRIDNQLRGRAGRQGDPGSTRFYVSLEDDIMRLFGGESISKIMTALKLPEDTPIENAMVSRAIENAQKKVEGHHFDNRKRVVEYDDVINVQREIIYKKRREILEAQQGNVDSENDFKLDFKQKIENHINLLVDIHINQAESPDYDQLGQDFFNIISFDPNSQKVISDEIVKLKSADKIVEFLLKIISDINSERVKKYSQKSVDQAELVVSLSVIDTLWMEHIDTLDDLRSGVGMRAYAQRDPLVEYKAESYKLFEKLISDIDHETITRVFKFPIESLAQSQSQPEVDPLTAEAVGAPDSTDQPITNKNSKNDNTKVGRNDPCPCGSGKKFKKCHGK